MPSTHNDFIPAVQQQLEYQGTAIIVGQANLRPVLKKNYCPYFHHDDRTLKQTYF